MTEFKSIDEVKEYLCDHDCDDAIIFSGELHYASAFIGISHNGRAVYDYDRMVDLLMKAGCETVGYDMDIIDNDTLRSIPYMGTNAPIVINLLE